MALSFLRRTELIGDVDGQPIAFAAGIHPIHAGGYSLETEYGRAGEAGDRVQTGVYRKSVSANRMFNILVAKELRKGFVVRDEYWATKEIEIEFEFALPVRIRGAAKRLLASFRSAPEVIKALDAINQGFRKLRVTTNDAFLPCFITLVRNDLGVLKEPDSETPPPLDVWIAQSTGRHRELLMHLGLIESPPAFSFAAAIGGAGAGGALVL